jgi:hypothetical protein
MWVAGCVKPRHWPRSKNGRQTLGREMLTEMKMGRGGHQESIQDQDCRPPLKRALVTN